ncbi:MAG TPA: GTP-binding protein, partial [bacterium]|nr:GTP-binding protein [bacterium]
LLKAGAQMASPGEFTRRAFVNGRVDLSRAEAVAMMTAAESRTELALAMKMLQGGLSSPIRRIRERILHILTAIELDLDFPEEAASISRTEMMDSLRDATIELTNLLDAGSRGEQLRGGREIVLAGRVNVGKSSVFNRLMARDRAIVSSEPGTTRDVLEAHVEWGESRITVIDTAGLRTSDSIAETIAVQRSSESLKNADLIVYIVDSTRPDIPLLEDVIHSVPAAGIIVFWNKIDIGTPPSEDQRHRIEQMPRVDSVIDGSALTGTGIDILRNRITSAIHRDSTSIGDLSLMITLRQKQSLMEARQALADAAGVFDMDEGSECAVPMLHEVNYLLGSIIGDTAAPDVLGTIFSSFCIGK